VIGPTEIKSLCGLKHFIAGIRFYVLIQQEAKWQREATSLDNSVSFVQ